MRSGPRGFERVVGVAFLRFLMMRLSSSSQRSGCRIGLALGRGGLWGGSLRRGGSLRTLLVLLSLLSADRAWAISVRDDVITAAYTQLAAQFPAVGRIDSGGFAHCTGTLVSATQVLTAAHCVDSDQNNFVDLDASTTTFRLGANASQPDSIHSVASIQVNRWSGRQQHDMAILTLTDPVDGVAPMNVSRQIFAGDTITMIGYGEHGTGVDFPQPFDGVRRAAQNVLDEVGTTLETDFDNPAGTRNTYGDSLPLPLEGTTAGGDSGGPITTRFLGVDVLIGVLHGGENPYDLSAPSEYGDISVWAPLSSATNRRFLTAQGIVIDGDYVSDGAYGLEDLDVLTTAIVTQDTSASSGLDLNADGQLDAADVDRWLAIAGTLNGTSYAFADGNLDGVVDTLDLAIWNAHRFSETPRWSQGDWNLDGIVDVSDFNVWNQFRSLSAASAVVPEPGGFGWGGVVAATLLARRRLGTGRLNPSG